MTAPSDTRLSPYEVIADYERRSLAHVAGLPEQLDAPGLWRGVGYRIGSHRLAEDAWGIFSLERLARTPEFRQAAA